MIPVVASLLYVDSVEVDEQKYPILVDERRLIPDSEGAGRQRGALGCRVVYGPDRERMTVAYTVEAHHNPPRGVRGGLDGGRSDAWKLGADGTRVDVPMAAALELEPGERIVSITAGGGGYGPPGERRVELVQEDLDEGWISRERAEQVYGVTVDADGRVRRTAV
jgi:N-methylhydantoinase B